MTTAGNVAWPTPHRSAACFTFDLDAEEVWVVDEDAAHRPSVLSQGTYGPKVAVPLILDILRRYEVRATFFVPGRVAERHPGAITKILQAGHEIGHHGHTHRSPADLSADEEQEEIERGLEALRALGATPSGYRAPSWDISERTLELVVRHGFTYSSNLMDDIRPYRHTELPLVELPIHWVLDDAPHFWFSGGTFTRTIRSVAETEPVLVEEGAGIAALGGLAVWTFHPQMIGRPGRLALLDRLIAAAVADPDIWVASAGKIADLVPRSVTEVTR